MNKAIEHLLFLFLSCGLGFSQNIEYNLAYAEPLLETEIESETDLDIEDKEESELEMETESIKNSFRLGAGLGHAHMRKGFKTNDTGISLASFYFDADYWVSNKIAFGLQTDVILEDYIVEERTGDGTEKALDRDHPFSIVPSMVYKPFKHLMFIGGYGEEFCKEENFSVLRAGAAYGIHLPQQWEFEVSAIYDVKNHMFDTWCFGIGVCKFLHGKKHN